MIASLRGNLSFLGGSRIVVDVGGVGYELHVTRGVLSQVRGIGEGVAVVVYTDVKENSISLFGFANTLEREVFLLLKKVKGVGSKIALAIISAMGPERLLANIGRQDYSSLTAVPGIGKKLAERLVVELRESVGEMAYEINGDLKSQLEIITDAAAEKEIDGGNVAGDAVLALEKLGFSRERSQRAVNLARKEATLSPQQLALLERDAGELVREALKNI